MNADEIEKAKEIVRLLRDAERNTELDCEINELRPTLTQAADLIENLTSQLAESQRREKAAVEDLEAILALACAAEVEGICNYCSDDGENCTGTTGWRGPQEAEKGETE